MITQIIKLQVADFNNWKSIHHSMYEILQAYGLESTHITVDAENGNQITLILDWNSPEKMQDYFQLPEVGEAMKNVGILSPHQVRTLIPKE